MEKQIVDLETTQAGLGGLGELVDHAVGGEEVVLTRHGEPVAKIVAVKVEAMQPAKPREPRQPGSAKGMFVVPDDFDETPEEFAEQM